MLAIIRQRFQRSKLARVGWDEWFFYGFTLVLIIGLKLAWRNVPPTEPRVFLSPLVTVLQFLTGTVFSIRPDGYFSPALGVLITKDCGGMNYFLIAHGLLVYACLRFFQGTGKVWAYAAFLTGAYGLTLLANTSRVMITIFLGRTGLLPAALTGKPHLAVGAFVYFFF